MKSQTSTRNALVCALREAVFRSPGQTSEAQRRAAAANEVTGPELARYIGKVHNDAYRISDEDVEALATVGHSEDAIFELTAAAALGAGLRRLELGLAAMTAPPVLDLDHTRGESRCVYRLWIAGTAWGPGSS